MPLTGRLDADFSTFQTAVDQAVVKLRSFETGSAKVGDALDRMGNRFSGVKIIQDTILMTEAIEQLGGASTLTQAELERVGAQAAEAAEKMERLGMDVPDKIKNLAVHAKAANDEFKTMKEIATSLVGGFSAAFLVDRAIQFGAAIANDAVQLRNLSAQTQIAVEDLQSFEAVLGDLGITSEQIGQAVNQLANRVAGGDKSAAATLHGLGLTIEELKNKKPAELFVTLVDAIGNVADPIEKLQRAGDLFGDRLGSALAKTSTGFRQAVNDARALNTVMSTETVNSIAKASDNWDRMTKNLKNITAELAGGWVDAMNAMVEASDRGVSKWAQLVALIKDGVASATGFATGPATNMLNLLAGGGAPGAGGGRDISLPSDKKAPTMADTFYAIQLDALKPLTEEQRIYMEQLYDIGQLTAENAKQFKVSAEQMAAFQKEQEETIDKQQKASEQLKDMNALALELTKKYNEEQNKINAALEKQLDLKSRAAVAAETEAAAAKKINEARGFARSGGVEDPLRMAAEARDAELERIAGLEKRGLSSAGANELRFKADEDMKIAMGLLKDVAVKIAATPPPMTTTVNVSGVLDPRTINELTDAISNTLLSRLHRQLGS